MYLPDPPRLPIELRTIRGLPPLVTIVIIGRGDLGGTSWSLSAHSVYVNTYSTSRFNLVHPLTSPVHRPSRASISALASKSLCRFACFNLVYLVLQLSHQIFRSRSNLVSRILSFGPYCRLSRWNLLGNFRSLSVTFSPSAPLLH
jgi:hypothetical protein